MRIINITLNIPATFEKQIILKSVVTGVVIGILEKCKKKCFGIKQNYNFFWLLQTFQIHCRNNILPLFWLVFCKFFCVP